MRADSRGQPMSPVVTIAGVREHWDCGLPTDQCEHWDYALLTWVAAWERHYGRPLAEDEPLPLVELAGIPWVEPGSYETGPPSAARVIWALRCCWDSGGREVALEVSTRAAARVVRLTGPVERAVYDAAVRTARAAVATGVGEAVCVAAVCLAARTAARTAGGTAAGTWTIRVAAWAAEEAAQRADLLDLLGGAR